MHAVLLSLRKQAIRRHLTYLLNKYVDKVISRGFLFGASYYPHVGGV